MSKTEKKDKVMVLKELIICNVCRKHIGYAVKKVEIALCSQCSKVINNPYGEK